MTKFGIQMMKFGAALLSLLISVPLALLAFVVLWSIVKSLGA